MIRDNDVFQVLVTRGSHPVLEKDKSISDLKDGQIGVFDAETNISIGSSAQDKLPKDFYLAVGADTKGNGIVDKALFSAGTLIQSNNLEYITFRPHTPSVAQIVEITDFKVDCETDYAIRIEFRNQKIYKIQGSTQFAHTYHVRTSCCEKCNECGSGDCNELVKLFVENINLDPRGLVKAEAIDPTTGNIITNIDKFIEDNAAVNGDNDSTNNICLKIRLTANPLAIQDFCNISASYYNERDTTMFVTLLDGFKCAGVVKTILEPQFEEGNGRDIKELEYKAGGWNGRSGGPYKVSDISLLPMGNFEYYANSKVKYDRLVIAYKNVATGGWLDYQNSLSTIIAVPESEKSTMLSLVAILDRYAEKVNLPKMTDAVNDANINPSISEPTSEKGIGKDGIS